MTTEPDPADVVPTDNSLGAPVEDSQLEGLTQSDVEDSDE
jgi:hypothetical protein